MPKDEMNPDALAALVESEGADLDKETLAEEEDAGFEAGFNRAMGREEPAAEKPEDEPKEADQAKDEGKPKEAPEDDPEAKQPNEKDETIKQLQDRLRVAEGRYGDANDRLKKLEKQLKQAKPVDKDAIRDEIAQALKDEETLKSLKDTFPEEYTEALETMERRFETRLEKMKEESAPQLDGYITQDQAESMAKEARELAKLDIRHEGWEDLINSPEFHSWYPRQEKELQQKLFGKTAKEVSAVLDKYAEEKQAKQSKESRLKRATTPKTTEKAPARQPQGSEDDFLVAGFNKVRGGR